MRALYKKGPGADVSELMDRPIPQVDSRDNIRVKVIACAVCGMDVHIMHGKFKCDPPFIMGHEFVGRVETVGPGASTLKVGDRVVAQPHLYACGHCEMCRRGFPQYCPEKRSLGINRDGAMAEYVVLPERYLHKVPDSIPDTLCCLLEPMTILVSDVMVYSKLRPGERVLITGAGQIAQLGIVAAKAAGAGTILVSGVTGDVPVRFPAALALGADVVIDAMKEDAAAKVMELTGGQGVDLVLEASGAEAGINAALAALRTGGRMCVLGGTKRDSIQVNWDVALRKMLRLEFHMMSDYQAMDKAIALFANPPCDLSPLVTHVAPLEDWARIFDELTQGKGIKAVLTL